MRCRTVLPWTLCLLATASLALAQGHGHAGGGHGGFGQASFGYGSYMSGHGASWSGHSMPIKPIYGSQGNMLPIVLGSRHSHSRHYAVAPAFFGWAPTFGIVPYMPPLVMVGPGSFLPAGPALPPQIVARGLQGIPRAGFQGPQMNRAGQPARLAQPNRHSDTTRSTQLATLGDRLFRGGNLHRAAERFEQAMLANPNSAAPRVRLAQVAIMRGNYAEAANRFREAQAAEPGWMVNAPDIQAIYGEPGDFAAPIAKLETHLQAHPNDRDAWLVLGAQWYLSGRTRQAADVFRRLTDRPADSTLTAFLDATTPQPLPPAAQ